MRGISNFLFFQINGAYRKKWFKQRKHIYLIFILSQFYAKVSDYRAVGLSSRRTIDTHPCYGLASVVVRRAWSVNIFQELLCQSWPNCACSIFRVRRQETVNFFTPHAKGRKFGGKKWKIDVFL